MSTKKIGPALAYDHLQQIGVTPDSTMDQISKANFEIMRLETPDPAINTSWEKLHRLTDRLEVDFFLFQVLSYGD